VPRRRANFPPAWAEVAWAWFYFEEAKCWRSHQNTGQWFAFENEGLPHMPIWHTFFVLVSL
jgi:hypothetical protein